MTPDLIVVGSLKSRHEQEDALRQIEKLEVPAIACVTSGLRFLKHPLLDHSRDFSGLKAENILKLGGRVVAKGITQLLEKIPPSPPFSKEGESEAIAKIISCTDWREHALFLGNSMPIRDMDTHAIAGEHIPIVGANRGASGIDGIISTACGFAHGLNQPTVLVLGDMTFLHDVSGLSFLKDLHVPVTIVVINNQGNGIFRTLPIASETELFERYFLVPHTYNLSGACQIYGIRHQPVDASHFKACYNEALQSEKSQVIEVLTCAYKPKL
ncbi:MAG: thiamine pyrophosphate-dependent enzyme [Myxococcota bacterium]